MPRPANAREGSVAGIESGLAGSPVAGRTGGAPPPGARGTGLSGPARFRLPASPVAVTTSSPQILAPTSNSPRRSVTCPGWYGTVAVTSWAEDSSCRSSASRVATRRKFPKLRATSSSTRPTISFDGRDAVAGSTGRRADRSLAISPARCPSTSALRPIAGSENELGNTLLQTSKPEMQVALAKALDELLGLDGRDGLKRGHDDEASFVRRAGVGSRPPPWRRNRLSSSGTR